MALLSPFCRTFCGIYKFYGSGHHAKRHFEDVAFMDPAGGLGVYLQLVESPSEGPPGPPRAPKWDVGTPEMSTL